jgi:hypothetical protein
MFVPDRLKANAYRALRLSAEATLSEIHKAAATMRRGVSLGLANATDAPYTILLGEIPNNKATIQTATSRLENTSERVRDRLFWFHSATELNNAQACTHATEVIRGEPDGVAWVHDKALRGLFAALETGLDDAGILRWVRALREWHQVVSNDDYWALTLALDERGAFEPAVRPSEIDALRKDAIWLAAEPLIAAARDAVARDDAPTVRRIIATLEELIDTGPWSATAQHDIVSPIVERLQALCLAVRKDFGAKVVRGQDAGEVNKSICDAALKRFREEVEPALNKIFQLVPLHHEVAHHSREQAALCLNGIATDYTWADDFVVSEKLNEEALRIAHDTLAAIRIEHALAQVREGARKQRASEALTPISCAAIESLQLACRAVREEYSAKIVREQNAGEVNRITCDAALKRFREGIEPALNNVLQLMPLDHEAAHHSRDRAALCLNGIATDYTWADDFIVSEKLREEALSLAYDAEAVVLIEKGLTEIRAAAHHQRIFGAPISSAPSLFTFNGFGVTLYGSSDYDKKTQSYATTHYLVALFIPIFPIGRYRVINTAARQYRFLGKLPLRKADRWHLGVAATAIVAMILFGVFSSESSNVIAPSPTTTNYGTDPRPDQRAPQRPLPSSPQLTRADAEVVEPRQQTPSFQQAQLAALKAQIESGRSRIAILEAQLQPVIEELKSLNERMEPLSAELKSLKEQKEAGGQIDIDDYNAKVENFNALLIRHRALVAANSGDLQTYEDLEKEDSVLVKRYNASLK